MTINNNEKKEIILSDNDKLIKYSSSLIKRGLELANSITQEKTEEFVNKLPELTTKEDIQVKANNWRCIHILTGHSKEIVYQGKSYTIWGDNNSISISDDYLLLASINKWGKAEIWDISKRQLIYSLDCSYDFDQYNNRSDWLSELSLMPYTLGQSYYISILIDNQNFITINSNEIKKWNLATKELKYRIPGSAFFDINQDKQIIVIEDNDSIKIINLFNGNVLHTLPLEDFYTLENIVISRNGIFIAASGSKFLNCHQDENGEEYYETQNSIKVWNVFTGELLHTLNEEIDITSSKNISSINISPEGKYLVSVDNYLSTDGLDEIYKVWNLHTGELLYILPIEANGLTDRSIITSNGQLITVTNGDSIIKVWEIQTGKLLTSLIGHSDSVHCLAINSNNQMLISGSADKTVKFWNLSTGELLETLNEHEYPVKSITVSPSGQIIASTDNKGTTILWKAS